MWPLSTQGGAHLPYIVIGREFVGIMLCDAAAVGEKGRTRARVQDNYAELEWIRCVQGYVMRYRGHISRQTIKDVAFVGPGDCAVASGSDDGRMFIWDRFSGPILLQVSSNLDQSPQQNVAVLHECSYDGSMCICHHSSGPSMLQHLSKSHSSHQHAAAFTEASSVLPGGLILRCLY